MILFELDGYAYPDAYRSMRERDADGDSGGNLQPDAQHIHPWQFIDDIDEATTVRKEFLLEVGRGSIPIRDILPFAKHSVTDDYAGFIQKNGSVTGEICVVHLTFRHAAEVSGYPLHTTYPSLEQWLATFSNKK